MIKDRHGDKCTRVCDRCGHKKSNVSYWNLVRKSEHLCRSCAYKGINSGRVPHNKGIRQAPKCVGNVSIHSDGYPMVWVGKDKIAYGYMPVHRLIASDSIGRLVTKQEKVHHINNNREDYRPENLYICRSMGHHRAVHNQLEEVAMYLVRAGAIGFNMKEGKYELSRPMERFIEEKQGELLETPNAVGEDNQQLSSAELAEKVQRLFREEVPSSGGKRPAPEKDDDIVCSNGKPLAGYSSGEPSSEGS